MKKMKMESIDLIDSNIEKIESIFPAVISETVDESGMQRKCVDFEKLKELLSEYIPASRESYELKWPGKKEALAEALKPIRKTLRPKPNDSLNWETTENLYIEGDNLEVLKLLQESYLGKVSQIYIDPPYNTGHDFIYPDTFTMSESRLNELTEYYDEDGNINYNRTNNMSSPRYHSDWCSMIYSRLTLARNLLMDDGIIVISIDDNEITNLRKICDEVFGEGQFISQITLLCNPKGRSQDMYVATCHEYLLVYSKTPLGKGDVSIPKSESEIQSDYPLTDDNGPYRELELRNTHRDFGKFNRPNLYYPLYVDESGTVTLEDVPNAEAVFPIWDDGFEGCWTWGKDKAATEINLLSAKKIKGKWKIYRKSYAYDENNVPLKMVKSIWNDKSFFTEKGQKSLDSLFANHHKLFQSPKSVDLIKQCIQMNHHKDGIILDFFSGSGTTAQAVIELNSKDGGKRKFILVQIPEKVETSSNAGKLGFKTIPEIARERLKLVSERMGSTSSDAGFRTFVVDSSNMNDVFYPSESYTQATLFEMDENIKEDRNDLDLLFGCLLEWGLELSKPYKVENINGSIIHIYNDRPYAGADLIGCFDKNVNEEVIREIASRHPYRAIFRDSSFKSDAERINLEEIFKLLSPQTEVKVL